MFYWIFHIISMSFLENFQGLTTGGLPTFIDVGNSFGAPAIIEDNLIHQVFIFARKRLNLMLSWFLYWLTVHLSLILLLFMPPQLVKNGKRVLMMGDDTWMQLFPEHFEESHPYPSFNVKDLDTVCFCFKFVFFLQSNSSLIFSLIFLSYWYAVHVLFRLFLHLPY